MNWPIIFIGLLPSLDLGLFFFKFLIGPWMKIFSQYETAEFLAYHISS